MASRASEREHRVTEASDHAGPNARGVGVTCRKSVASEVALDRVRELLHAEKFDEALVACESIDAGAAQSRDALYLLAVSQRLTRRVPNALATLDRLEERHPGFGRLFQERGHCYVAQRKAGEAIEAFERAVRVNPALPASWRVLSRLYRMNGRLAEADNAASQVAKLASLPVEVVTASALLADGDLYEAERLVRRFLLIHEDHIEAMRLLARIAMQLDILDDAELLLEGVLLLSPDYHAARYDYAIVLHKRHEHMRALEEIARLLKVDAANRDYRTAEAAVYMGLGDARALALYRRLLAEMPGDPGLHLSVGHALKTLGRPREAIESYRAATAARSSYGEAYWSLADLKTYRFTDSELERMRIDEARPGISTTDRYHLCFALGKALEDRGDYGDSFAHYARGNDLKLSECRYRPEITETNARLQVSICTDEFIASRRAAGCPSIEPIFIVGLPRAGSTLLEQILASHSQVEGTHELANVPRIAAEIEGPRADLHDPRYPGKLTRLRDEDFRMLGQRYLAETRAYRGHKPYFVDKMPNNFRHLGLIQLILPNAKIIDVRREPMACCLGNLKQLFASGQEFTYRTEDIARYYRTYLELMRHWDAVLPGRVLRVWYEDVVGDLEASVRRILEFCGLEWEPLCLEFHKTHRSVRTASSEQVRLPIFRDGLSQWRNYERWLAPLKDSLGDALIRYRE